MEEHGYEYGYRLADGEEVWAVDHGSDGTWTPYDRERGIEAIDLYGDDAAVIAAIKRGLKQAGVEGHPIRKSVTTTYGETEVIIDGDTPVAR